MYALVDCNNFYASCERVFQPRLKGQPIVILSNNDGCVIARSNEAKKLGIDMGVPYFKIRPLIERHGVVVRSSNYELYGDMSRRVMLTLALCAPDIEIYSIDEAFFEVSGFTPDAMTSEAIRIRTMVLQWTGIPTSVGIATTKTLAKVANHQAKKGDGAFVIADEGIRRAVLAIVKVRDVWGIGRQHAQLLMAHGVDTALALSELPDGWVRKHLHVTGLRTVHELRGIPCFSLDEQPVAKKSITTSRMFGRPITELEELSEAMASYTARAAEKLRAEHRFARHIDLFFYTSPFKQPGYTGRASYDLALATDYTPTLLDHVLRGVRGAFRSGYQYVKGGIILSHFVALEEQQLSLFSAPDTAKEAALMQSLDIVNRKWGKGSLFYAATGTRKAWAMKREFRSRSYSTRLDELLCIR